MKLTPDPKNPNRMESEDKARMALSLAEFGDLSGIVINRRTGLLVGGHQRADVLAGGNLAVDDLKQPDPDGTVARGWLDHGGRRYAVRVVDWPDYRAHAAMIAANRFGRVGHDDAAVLADLMAGLEATDFDLDLTGFNKAERERVAGQFNVDEAGNPILKDGDRAPFRQANFTLHDEQWEAVEAAIAKAKADGHGESAVNENSNGNALAWIAEVFNRG